MFLLLNYYNNKTISKPAKVIQLESEGIKAIKQIISSEGNHNRNRFKQGQRVLDNLNNQYKNNDESDILKKNMIPIENFSLVMLLNK